jgi:TrmH family RNA methyltransferase
MDLSLSRLKQLRSLATKKGREEKKKFLIEGLRLCQEAFHSDWRIETVLYTQEFVESKAGKQLIDLVNQNKFPSYQIKNAVLKKLSDTKTPPGILFEVSIKEFELDSILKKNLILLLDHLQDPGNLGTLIRSADAFGFGGIILSEGTVELFNPKVVRSTMGSLFHLPILTEVNLPKIIPKLKKENFQILSTDLEEGTDFEEVKLFSKIALIIGNETQGVSSEIFSLADEKIKIPLLGKAESLNASVAGGILMYELCRGVINQTPTKKM